MALQSGIPVSFEAYFPRGAFMVGEIEAVVKWSDDGQRQGQDLDKNSGHPLWQVRVIDADLEARKGQNEVTVKIASIAEPTAFVPESANKCCSSAYDSRVPGSRARNSERDGPSSVPTCHISHPPNPVELSAPRERPAASEGALYPTPSTMI